MNKKSFIKNSEIACAKMFDLANKLCVLMDLDEEKEVNLFYVIRKFKSCILNCNGLRKNQLKNVFETLDEDKTLIDLML